MSLDKYSNVDRLEKIFNIHFLWPIKNDGFVFISFWELCGYKEMVRVCHIILKTVSLDFSFLIYNKPGPLRYACSTILVINSAN